MALLKVLSCSLIFIVAAAPFINAQLYYLHHCNIHFILYANQDIFHGEYNVSTYIPYDTQHIYCYTENLFISKTILTNNTQISKENEEKVSTHRAKKFVHDLETYITTISFPYVLSSGSYILYMKFSGLLAEDGGFRTSYMNQQNNRVWLAATHYHTFATRRLFPFLKDATYVSYNISIKHHKNYTALSNMPVRAMNIDTNNMIWTHFQITPRMAENMIAVGLVHLTPTFESNQRVRFWCRIGILQSVKFAHTTAKFTLQFLETRFPNIRKTPEINHIAIPKLLDEEDIKLGFVLYREADIIFDSESDYEIRQILEITQVVTYKMVHEWLYNAINPAEWEPWLNKGLATFLGICAANEISPHLWIPEHFVVQMQHDFLHWSTKDTWPLTIESKFNNSFEIPRYIKATIMFRTLQTVLTEKMFRNSIKIYLNQLYTSSNDFWNVMQSALDESSFGMKYNLEYKITNWIELNRYPVINVQRNYDKYSLNISVEDSNIDVWTLNIITQTNLKELLSVVWLTPHISYHSQIIKDFMGKNDWILVNSLQSGCYRVNYDAENWSRLSEYLNFNTFEKIHVLDRAKIIDDAFHFVMSGQFNLNLFLNISRYLRHDTDYIAWYPMFKNLEYMSGFFAFPESVSIKTEIMQSLHEIFPETKSFDIKLREIIWESASTKYLKQEAARWLCNMGHDYCLSKANDELEWYLLNRNKSSPYKIMNGWKEWTFCNGLIALSKDTWMEVFYMYSRESDYSILKFLACPKSASFILHYMHLMANMTNVTAIDRINSFCTIVARHAKNTPVFDFILDDLEKRKPKEISFITALTMIINHVYSKQQLNKIKKYTDINLKDNMEFAINYEHHENGDTVWKSLPLTMNMIKMYVNRKLELRFHQIKTQLYQYRYLTKDYDYIFKLYTN